MFLTSWEALFPGTAVECFTHRADLGSGIPPEIHSNRPAGSVKQSRGVQQMTIEVRRVLSLSRPLVLAIVLNLAPPAGAQFYKQTNLVSDTAGMAAITDLSLV